MSRCGEPFFSASTASRRTDAVDGGRMVAGKHFDGQERRSAARRAFVVEPAPQQLLLRAPVELPDRAVRDRALAEVLAAGRRLELISPLGAQVRELALGSSLGERVGLRGRFLQRHAGDSKYTADPWPIESYSFPATGRGPS